MTDIMAKTKSISNNKNTVAPEAEKKKGKQPTLFTEQPELPKAATAKQAKLDKSEQDYINQVAKNALVKKCMDYKANEYFSEALASVILPKNFGDNTSIEIVELVWKQISNIIYGEAKRAQINTMFTVLLNGIEAGATNFMMLDTFEGFADTGVHILEHPTKDLSWQPELAEIAIEMGDNYIQSPYVRLAIKMAQFAYNYHKETVRLQTEDQMKNQK